VLSYVPEFVRFFFLLLFLSSLQILRASVFLFIIFTLSELENLHESLVFCISPFLLVRVAHSYTDVMYSNKQRRRSSSRDWAYPLLYYLAALDEHGISPYQGIMISLVQRSLAPPSSEDGVRMWTLLSINLVNSV